MTRIASVDVGSNSVLMCVGEPLSSGDFRVVYDSARTTRLGAGMGPHRLLTRMAIRRTVEALRECRRKAQILGVAMAKAVATAAVREAANQDAFLAPAQEALGIPVEVVSGEREAQLTYLGVGGTGATDPVLIVDVGGSSTELVLAEEGKVSRVESLPIGAVRLQEAIPSEDILRFFVRVIEVIPPDLGPGAVGGRRAIIVGGTATTLAAMRLALKRYDADLVEGLTFDRIELQAMVERVRETPLQERYRIPGLPPNRVEIIASGGLVLVQILEELGVERCSISTRGVRHGLLAELARGKG